MPRVEEKRSAPRITTVIPVVCRVMGHGPQVLPTHRRSSDRGIEFEAKTINVSRDGILIHCDADMLPNTTLDMSLSAPTDGHLIRFQADVAWARRNSINLFGHYSAGLRIKKMAEKDRALLMEFYKLG